MNMYEPLKKSIIELRFGKEDIMQKCDVFCFTGRITTQQYSELDEMIQEYYCEASLLPYEPDVEQDISE